MMGDTQRLVARVAAAEAARSETAGELAALRSQLAAEQAAKSDLQAGLQADAVRRAQQQVHYCRIRGKQQSCGAPRRFDSMPHSTLQRGSALFQPADESAEAAPVALSPISSSGFCFWPSRPDFA